MLKNNAITQLFNRQGDDEPLQSIVTSVVVVHCNMPPLICRDDLLEFRELVSSTESVIVKEITTVRDKPDAKYFIGSGKAQEVADYIAEHEVSLVLFNANLTPAQERNLEKRCQCRVVDRTGLILDIFARRAQTHEGCLQVELAQLQHLSTRLVRGWSHLERQKGGVGLRGPGETQLETDRRLITERMRSLRTRLQKVQRQRQTGRQSRQQNEVPQVSLVGYTNAGKSTLFNRLALSDVYVQDQLFATLDPTLRKMKLPNRKYAVLADTVGFIRHLPHDLVESFRSTLEETNSAQLLLQVVDVASHDRQENIMAVNDVLKQVGASDIPQLLIYNKVDLLEDSMPRVDLNEQGDPWRVWVSASQDLGLDLIKESIVSLLQKQFVTQAVKVSSCYPQLRSLCYRLATVESDTFDESGDCWLLVLRISPLHADKLQKALEKQKESF